MALSRGNLEQTKTDKATALATLQTEKGTARTAANAAIGDLTGGALKNTLVAEQQKKEAAQTQITQLNADILKAKNPHDASHGNLATLQSQLTAEKAKKTAAMDAIDAELDAEILVETQKRDNANAHILALPALIAGAPTVVAPAPAPAPAPVAPAAVAAPAPAPAPAPVVKTQAQLQQELAQEQQKKDAAEVQLALLEAIKTTQVEEKDAQEEEDAAIIQVEEAKNALAHFDANAKETEITNAITPHKAKIAELETAFATQEERLGENHRAVRAAKTKLDDARQKLDDIEAKQRTANALDGTLQAERLKQLTAIETTHHLITALGTAITTAETDITPLKDAMDIKDKKRIFARTKDGTYDRYLEAVKQRIDRMKGSVQGAEATTKDALDKDLKQRQKELQEYKDTLDAVDPSTLPNKDARAALLQLLTPNNLIPWTDSQEKAELTKMHDNQTKKVDKYLADIDAQLTVLANVAADYAAVATAATHVAYGDTSPFASKTAGFGTEDEAKTGLKEYLGIDPAEDAPTVVDLTIASKIAGPSGTGTADKKYHVVELEVPAADAETPGVKCAALRKHDKKDEVRSEMFFNHRQLDDLKKFTDKRMYRGEFSFGIGTNIPCKEIMMFWEKAIMAHLLVQPKNKDGSYNTLYFSQGPNMTTQMLEGAVLYCRYAGIKCEAPLYIKDKVTNDQVKLLKTINDARSADKKILHVIPAQMEEHLTERTNLASYKKSGG